MPSITPSSSSTALLTPISENFWRSLQTFNFTRVVVATVLLIYTHLNNRGIEVAQQFQYADTGLFYLMAAIGLTLCGMYFRRQFTLQLLVQITLDITIISLLYLAAGGARSGLQILYLLPLAGAAVLARLTIALFFVSIVALFLLLEGTYQIFMGVHEVPLLQTSMYGAAYFTTVVVVSRLAGKLIRQEQLAFQRGRDLQLQMAINRLVIADVGDGILVLDPESTVMIANPAAKTMLGMLSDELSPEKRVKLSNSPHLKPIVDAYQNWLSHLRIVEHDQDHDAPVYVLIRPIEDSVPTAGVWSGRRELNVHLKLRFVHVETESITEQRCVVFLRDVSEIENQAQQLKLASMGRLTASIAHEVRNPLAAISHAAALLSEELNSKTQVRLLNIVGDNVTRVNRMIEDILQLSRKVQPNHDALPLSTVLAEICNEFQETHGLADGLMVLGTPSQALVRFDPLHLREVIVNLLSNAVRYASGRPGSIRLQEVFDGDCRLQLHVQDDGPGITPEVRAHLFEPFYTTSSKGTGLGLYLARELCMNNGAMLDYEYRVGRPGAGIDQASGRFVISFAQLENT